MRVVKWIIAVVAVMFTLELTACGDTPPEYITASVSFSEPYGESYETGRAWETEQDGITYYFANQISEEGRNAVVAETKKLVWVAEERLGMSHVVHTVCMREDNYLPRVQDGTLYIGFENFKTQDYAIGICQMLLGNEVNYGLLYGMGRELALEQGYAVEELGDLADALTLCDTAAEYLDMNYACFLEAYADAQTLLRVKTLAEGFYRWLQEKEEAVSLLADYSWTEYCVCLNRFLKENGKAEYDGTDMDGIWFYNGGNKLRIVWEDANAVFYVAEEFKAALDSGIQPEDSLASGYGDLRLLAANYYKQSQYVDQILGKYDPDIEAKISVRFTGEAEEIWTYGGVYLGTEEIRLKYFFAFMHEYIHYMVRDTSVNEWCNEMLASYYPMMPLEGNVTYTTCFRVVNEYFPDNGDSEYVRRSRLEAEAKSRLGHEFNYDSPKDIAYIYNVDVLIHDCIDGLMADNGGNAVAQVSFFEYLKGLADEEAVLDAVVNDTPEEVFGKDWNMLAVEWSAWVEEEFGWVLELESDS